MKVGVTFSPNWHYMKDGVTLSPNWHYMKDGVTLSPNLAVSTSWTHKPSSGCESMFTLCLAFPH